MTNPQQELWKGVNPVAGAQPLRPNRRFEILAKDFTSAEQAAPLRVVYGRPKPFAGSQITPIFGFRNEPIQTKVGK